MDRITVISDSVGLASDHAARLARYFETECFQVSELPAAAPGELVFIDIDLRDAAQVSRLRGWLRRRPTNGQVIFGVNQESHVETIQAYAIGATGLVPRPVDGRLLSRKLSGGRSLIAKHFAEATAESRAGISSGMNALQTIFAAAISRTAPDLHSVSAAGVQIVDGIEEDGLSRWLDAVRKHHSQTYQHCLVVTAVAVSLGRHLGFSNADKQRLALAGLLHDIGKARIPIEILEKPAPLSETEIAIMRTHPELGFEALRGAPGLQPELLDMVAHHHEYLDGSGYPYGLQGSEISDLVRLITIADIYGALIERRPYRSPMPGPDAYQILADMGPKLDQDLVRAFRPVAQGVI